MHEGGLDHVVRMAGFREGESRLAYVSLVVICYWYCFKVSPAIAYRL